MRWPFVSRRAHAELEEQWGWLMGYCLKLERENRKLAAKAYPREAPQQQQPPQRPPSLMRDAVMVGSVHWREMVH